MRLAQLRRYLPQLEAILAPTLYVTPRGSAALFCLNHLSGAMDEPFGDTHGDRPCDKESSNEQDQKRHQAEGRILIVDQPTDQKSQKLKHHGGQNKNSQEHNRLHVFTPLLPVAMRREKWLHPTFYSAALKERSVAGVALAFAPSPPSHGRIAGASLMR